jgi:hypothetical protein
MDADVARAALARHGTTYADEAGIRLADEPSPLFQLLVLAQPLSARIGAGVAVTTAVWPWVRPFLDDRARDGARRLGLPGDAAVLAGWSTATSSPGSPQPWSGSHGCPRAGIR